MISILSSSNVSSPIGKHCAMTKEEDDLIKFNDFKSDAGCTVLTAFGSLVSGIALNTANIFKTSHRSEIREKYGMNKDYTTEENLSAACDCAINASRKYDKNLSEFVSDLNAVSKFSSISDKDYGEKFMDRCDACDEEFSNEYENIRKVIYNKFKPYKCSDPMALYRLLYAIFMARRFNAVSEYIEYYSPGFGKREPLNILTKMRVTEHLQNIARRAAFKNKSGEPFVFLFTNEERIEYDELKRKKSWQKKNDGKTFVEIDIWKLFSEDDIIYAVWKLEIRLMELKTIDKLISIGEGKDPEYRFDYRMKRLQSGSDTFEESMLNSTIICYRWSELAYRLRNFIDSMKSFKCIDKKRPPVSVVCFDIKKDNKGKIIMMFRCVFNSVSQAEREMAIKASVIRKYIDKYDNDGYNHIWMSIGEYCKMTYRILSKEHPELIDEFEKLLPEYTVKDQSSQSA